MNKGIDYVICAAGAGQRMQELAGGRPKPLVEMMGRTLLEISIESLDLYPNDRLIIVVQKAHQVKKELQKKFSEKYPLVTTEWLEIDGLTKGQLETAYLAKKYFRADAGLVVFNSDTYFRSAELNAAMQSGAFDGIIPCSKQAGDAWSFCKTDAS